MSKQGQSGSYVVEEEEEDDDSVGMSDISNVSSGLAVESKMNGDATTTSSSSAVHGRYGNVLSSVGLEGLKQVHNLPDKRQVSSTDVFCNRELRLGGISAIGFDMDYTLAQYKQPAFDQLAFDGAKQKLVEKLGYPPEVLDFEYDHTVRSFSPFHSIPSHSSIHC